MAEPRAPRRQPRPSLVPREVLASIDATERRVGFVLASISALFALLFVYLIVFVKTYKTRFIETPKSHVCSKGYTPYTHSHGLINTCSRIALSHYSDSVLILVVVVLAAAALWYFSWARKRTGLTFSALFVGVMVFGSSPLFGLIFLASGLWIMWRAWRLQKYGVATFTGVSQITKQRATDRREGRTPSTPVAPTTASDVDSTPAGPRRASEASKRYTPKKPPRKKR